MGLAAFKWGRMAVIDPAFVEAEIAQASGAEPAAAPLSPRAQALLTSTGAQGEAARLLEIRIPELIAYQNEAYATRYASILKSVITAEQHATPGQTGLSEAAARYLHKLMAYKDEYEVARLHTDPAFLAKLQTQFKNGYKVKYSLAPPLLSKRDPITGELQKREFGPWVRPAFTALAKLKFLRGTALDIFGKTEERQHERQMIEDYITLLSQITAALTPANHAAAIALASVPDEIRGYGHVKQKSIAAARELQAQRLEAFTRPQLAEVA